MPVDFIEDVEESVKDVCGGVLVVDSSAAGQLHCSCTILSTDTGRGV